MKTRKLVSLAAWLLVLGACGADTPPATDAPDVAQSDNEGGSSDARGTKTPDIGSKGDKKQGSGAKGNGGQRPPAGGGSGDRGEGAEDDASSRWYPQQGVYVYAQTGSEEFCDASGCSRDELPRTQEVRTSYKSVSGDEAIVVTAAEASGSRFVRTTTRHTPSGAFITDVHLEFSYQGARFNNDYQPDPPVEAARLPLQAGMRWRGQWDDRTSGTYTVDVRDREEVNVGGRVVQAWPLHVETTFRGDFEGTSDVVVWVDPATAAIVRSSGRIDVSSFFGEYRTNFVATLREGPGYH